MGPTAAVLEARASAAESVQELADAVVDWLEARDLPHPSVYMELAGQLRCIAVRGYWQILEGFTVEHGVIAKLFQTGESQLVRDVRTVPEYIPAVPGVVSELCVPLRFAGRVVGGLNLESPRTLTEGDIAVVEEAARVFDRRLAELGGPQAESPWQRLARRSAELARLTDPDAISEFAVRAACEVTGFDSAVLVSQEDGRYAVRAAWGPLGAALRSLPDDALPAIASWTSAATAVYTIGSMAGSGFAGHEALRQAGVVALASATLPSGGERHGFLLAASREPMPTHHSQVQHLEVVAAHTASSLHTALGLEALRIRASQDSLTGLGHGGAFHEQVAAELSRGTGSVAVLLIDLDGFKHVNDTVGHLVGDRVLVETAQVLRSALDGDGTLFRIGGDEFAAVLTVQSESDATCAAESLCEVARSAARTTVSIGVTVIGPNEEITTDAVLAQADLALYETKSRGSDGLTLYRPDMRDAAVERAQMVADLAAGIPRNELRCDYQPIVSLRSGRVIGLEALVRWDHPERGLVAPLDFIPLAEEDGLISEVGRWVLEEVCRQTAAWEAEGWLPPDLRVGMNLSPAELHPKIDEDVAGALARHGLHPDRLVLEVTESVFIANRATAEPLRRLRAMGVHIAIDDFGTGYSSLSYLQRLPIDVLKIDRTFVTDLEDPASAAVLRAIVELAAALGVTMVAEGVEESEQEEQLRDLGCLRGQGFLWARPAAPEEIADICKARALR